MIIYTRPDGGISVIYPAPKKSIERDLGRKISAAEYKDIILSHIPEGSTKIREVSSVPQSREYRDAWCDVTDDECIDIDVSKVKDICLHNMRLRRNIMLQDSDKEYIRKLESGESLKDVTKKRKELRDCTEPLKAMDVSDIYNDVGIIKQIESLSKVGE